MTHDLGLIVPIDQSSAGDALLSQVYGSPQSGSFGLRLSATGLEPATHLGTYARGLEDDQLQLVASQEEVAWHEGNWRDCLLASGVQQIISADD